MTKKEIAGKLNRFYSVLATENPTYQNRRIMAKDLKRRDQVSAILYDLKTNGDTHRVAPSLFREVKRLRHKKQINIVRIIDTVLVVIGVCLLLWFSLSWVEVWCKNLSPDPQYSPINLLVLLFGGN